MPTEFILPINNFRGEYDFLSNFFRHPFAWRDIEWQTSEHAFQAVKTTTMEEFEYVKNADSPAKAKRRGREIRCREDWEQIKEAAMLDILRAKFAPESWLASKLVATGSAELIEENKWHDNVWGVCFCPKCAKKKGRNLLGKTLMQIRAELKEGLS